MSEIDTDKLSRDIRAVWWGVFTMGVCAFAFLHFRLIQIRDLLERLIEAQAP